MRPTPTFCRSGAKSGRFGRAARRGASRPRVCTQHRFGKLFPANRRRRLLGASQSGARWRSRFRTVPGRRAVIWNLRPDRGPMRRTAVVDLPAAGLMHDFAVVAQSCPHPASDAAKRPAGQSLVDRYDWKADQPLRIVVLDKSDLTIRKVYEFPARFLFHIGNAWEDEAGAIRVDAFVDKDATFAVRTARELPLGVAMSTPTARLTQFSIYPDGRTNMAVLPGKGEFPRINPLRIGARHRFTYGVINRGIARWDLDAGKRTISCSAKSTGGGTRLHAGPDATVEDDGWIVATALNTE
ncbi:MAG: carotenoid oxygenase family protein [Alphaproteobacteria bacterium]